jgi:hypothetical protein
VTWTTSSPAASPTARTRPRRLQGNDSMYVEQGELTLTGQGEHVLRLISLDVTRT